MTLRSLNGSVAEDTNSTETSSSGGIQIVLSKTTRFWILFTFEVPSLLCCTFLLYHLLSDRKLRRPLHNHVLIVVLIFTFFFLIIDVPNYMTLFRLGRVWPATPVNCYVWLYVDIVGYYGLGMLMAWASIERHILVFHRQWLNTTKQLLLVHYLPLACVTLYPCLFYIILIFFVPCEQTIDYSQYTCSGACAYSIRTLAMLDGFINGDLPTFVITLFNVLLVVRIIRQKQRLHQRLQWRRHRRVTVQLVACSAPFIVLNLPLVCIYVGQSLGLPYGATGQFEMFLYFMAYFVVLWMPFVCLGASHEVLSKARKMVNFPYFNNTVTLEP